MVEIKDLLFNEGMKSTLKDVTNLKSETDVTLNTEKCCKSDCLDNLSEKEFDVLELHAKLKDYQFSPEIVNNSASAVEYSNMPNVHNFIAFANKAGQHLGAHSNKMDSLIYKDYLKARPKVSVQQHSKKSNSGTESTTRLIVGGKSDFCDSSKILTNLSFCTRNPFLHHWETDEDRPGGGSWTQRKELYNHTAGKFSKSELYSLATSESHKENVLNPAKKRKFDSSGINSGTSEALMVDDHHLALLNTFRPELTGYRWSDDGTEELLLFWR